MTSDLAGGREQLKSTLWLMHWEGVAEAANDSGNEATSLMRILLKQQTTVETRLQVSWESCWSSKRQWKRGYKSHENPAEAANDSGNEATSLMRILLKQQTTVETRLQVSWESCWSSKRQWKRGYKSHENPAEAANDSGNEATSLMRILLKQQTTVETRLQVSWEPCSCLQKLGWQYEVSANWPLLGGLGSRGKKKKSWRWRAIWGKVGYGYDTVHPHLVTSLRTSEVAPHPSFGYLIVDIEYTVLDLLVDFLCCVDECLFYIGSCLGGGLHEY